MKKLQIILLLLITSQFAISQVIDYNKIIAPEGSRPRYFEDYLVQLAWQNHPSNRILEYNKEIAVQKLKIARKSWTKHFNLTFNLNEREFQKDDNLFPNQYPKYNFAAIFNLEDFFKHPAEKKIAIENTKIADAYLNEKKLKLRADVLNLYENYLLTIEVHDMRSKAEQDASQTYLLITEKFKKDEASFEDLSAASSTYHAAQESTITANSEVRKAKISLEEMIGVRLEDARKKAGFRKGAKRKSK